MQGLSGTAVRWLGVLAAMLLLGGRARAEEEAPSEPRDLGLYNFFDGWNSEWRVRKRRTPDMAILKATTNFLEREFRLDFVLTDVRTGKTEAQYLVNGLIAYGVSRRLMLEVISNYQWNTQATGAPQHGGGGGALARVQLVENDTQSYAFQAKLAFPNRGIGQTQTSMAYSLTGWQDLQALIPFLDRVGLYFSVTWENLLGSHATGARENDLSYDVSLAKTWTAVDAPVFGKFTTFLEFYGTTDLDGAHAGWTVFTITPGIRFWFLPVHSLMAGVDIPVSANPTFALVYRVTYIMNFE
jgi:hypothetical protein